MGITESHVRSNARAGFRVPPSAAAERRVQTLRPGGSHIRLRGPRNDDFRQSVLGGPGMTSWLEFKFVLRWSLQLVGNEDQSRFFVSRNDQFTLFRHPGERRDPAP